MQTHAGFAQPTERREDMWQVQTHLNTCAKNTTCCTTGLVPSEWHQWNSLSWFDLSFFFFFSIFGFVLFLSAWLVCAGALKGFLLPKLGWVQDRYRVLWLAGPGGLEKVRGGGWVCPFGETQVERRNDKVAWGRRWSRRYLTRLLSCLSSLAINVQHNHLFIIYS